MPAQTDAQQLNVPVFRMLGSDPIYQYDTGLGGDRQGVISLEPVYPESGGDPKWVRWFMDANFASPCLAFAYTQAGQENSFGWPAMSKGLEYQYGLIAEQARDGRVKVQTLEASGKWFRETFDRTPATAVVVMKDWRGKDRRSVWYESRFYRVNLYWEGGGAWRIRDLHVFNEKYAERYLTERVTTNHCTYDTLPVLDGFKWSSGPADPAGLRFVSFAPDGAAQPIECGEPAVTESAKDSLLVTIPIRSGGELKIHLEPGSMRFETVGESAPNAWGLKLAWSTDKPAAVIETADHAVRYRHNGFAYSLDCGDAGISKGPDARSIVIRPDGRMLKLSF